MSFVTLQYNCSNDIPVWMTLQNIISAMQIRVGSMVIALMENTNIRVNARVIILGKTAIVSIILYLSGLCNN